MKIFISYSHDDTEIANTVTSILEDEDILYFRDVKNIRIGERIPEKVSRALADCSALLVIVSSASLESNWCQYEIGQADALRKDVLPYLTQDDLKLPLYISDRSHASSVEELRRHFQHLKATTQSATKVGKYLHLKLEFTFEKKRSEKSKPIFLGDCKSPFEFERRNVYELMIKNGTQVSVWLNFEDREVFLGTQKVRNNKYNAVFPSNAIFWVSVSFNDRRKLQFKGKFDYEVEWSDDPVFFHYEEYWRRLESLV